MEQVTLTRRELYDLVWSTPMTTIAKKYLISDVGLRKICISMNIPLPRVGHWEKIKAGKHITIVPLPEKFEAKGEIILKLRTENDPAPSQKDPVRALAEELSNQNIPFKVPDILTSKDSRIINAQKALTEKNQYLHRGLASSGRGNLSINVSPQNINRALCFMQGLISALEKRGHQLKINSEETVVVVSGQSIMIALREKVKIKRVPNKWGSFDNIYEPEGSLIFELGKYGAKEWRDGSKKLEERLPEIMARMEIEAKSNIEAEIERKEREDERMEKERQRKAVELRQKQELNEFRKLVVNADRWQLAQHLRAYLEQLEKQAEKTNTLTDELKEWLNWAQHKVNWYDPLINAKDEWLSDEDKNNIFVQEKNIGNSFFNHMPEPSPYFPRPWYTRDK